MTLPDGHLLKAPLRWWRSRGFGIHSPFAYVFVDEVVRNRYAYYAYAPLRRAVKNSGRRLKCEKKSHRQISYPAACMLHRLGARLDLRNALVVGHTDGVAESALCHIHTDFRLFVADKGLWTVFDSVTEGLHERITCFRSVADAIDAYSAVAADKRMLIVNNTSVCGGNAAELTGFARSVLEDEGVVVVRNMHEDNSCRLIATSLRGLGVEFTNGKSAVFVNFKYLHPQRYVVKMPF